MSLLRRIDDRWDRAAVLIDEAVNLLGLLVNDEDGLHGISPLFLVSGRIKNADEMKDHARNDE